ncbi:MAG TPA: IclR family transcriptional regulator [Solirubrobacteraceae bacterium]
MSAPEAWHVTRTMRTLEMLALRPRSAVDVAHALGVHPRTARRLLNRLLVEGYATRTGPHRRQYGMTLKLVALAGHALEQADLVREAAPFVQRLRDETAAPAQLSVASYRSALPLVDEQRPEENGRVRAQLGEKVPCHCSAAGKVLLAHRTRWCESVLSHPLEAYTERTPVRPEEVRDQLEEVARRGYAIEDGERVEGVGSVAAPVFDHNGEAVAALGVVVASDRVATEAARLAGLVVLAARGLSDALGFVEGAPAVDEGVSAALLEMVPAARSYAA